MLSIQLGCIETKHEPAPGIVAAQALRTARKPPGLLTLAARRRRILDHEGLFCAVCVHQGCIRLFVIPSISIRVPALAIEMEELRFYLTRFARLSRVQSQRKRPRHH